MRTLPLTAPVNVTLDGSGNGTAQIGPTNPGEVWYPQSVSISMTGNTPTNPATCLIYSGAYVAQTTFVDSTYNVLGASSSMILGKKLYPGQFVWAVFSQGNAGATATLVVYGNRTVP